MEILKKLKKRYEHHNIVYKIKTGRSIPQNRINVQIQSVSSCNGKCSFCPYQGSWHQKNPGIMSWENYKKIIDQLKGYKIVKFCPYLENEPLLDKEIFNKIRYALENLDIELLELSTNLSALSEHFLDEIGEIFPAINHEIRISFHGVDKISYEHIMGLSFEQALFNVSRLVRLAQELPLKIDIRGAGTPKSANGNLRSWFGEEKYLDFWKKQLAPFKNKPSVKFLRYHDRAGSIQLKDKGMSFNSIARESLDNFYCSRFDKWMHFLYTGEPILCCMDYNRETSFDDSITNKTIEELYASQRYIDLIKRGTGMMPSEDNFICKRCFSPGG
jgi:hypothetical protein